jgi:hypothetical protein
MRHAPLILLTVAACGGGSSSHIAPEPTPGSGATPVQSPPAAPLVDCAGLDGPAVTAPSLGSDWTAAQRTLTKHTGTAATIAVLTDAGGAAPATLAALGRLRAQLDAAHVDVVVSLGGLAGTAAEIQSVLTALATNASWPVIAMPGDLEPADAHASAIAALQAQHLPVVDGRLARFIELPGVTLATLPGVGAAARHASGPAGCGYSAAERDAIAKPLTQKTGLRVLASVEAPRSTAAGDPTGDLDLPANPGIDIVIHAASDTASLDTTGTRGGATTSLAPGSVDATPHLQAAHPTAGILTVRDGSWSWHVLDLAK